MCDQCQHGPFCVHEFNGGTTCGDVATWLTPLGRPLCEDHFGRWVAGASRPVSERADSRRIAA